ncbi:hypothetical protein D1632_10610 [Chryseobacterium nematophagum]|uniref:Uncharacterized protein n=1 Tax=Chryseobacterium nematophagum TaxID=2305228 RepID=A0A3M7LDB2_9FLAO|nr:hypothetical protein [Chryseobacterium nematophagum]RMZ60034.1 hypothetical protein D1632_10610 [Chryseobacterium nematophagum]
MKENENINIIDISHRLNDYILHLKAVKAIKTNQDIADTGIIAKSNLSRAVNGDEKYLTKSFIKKLVIKYPDSGYTFEDIWYGTSNKKYTQKKEAQFNELPIGDQLNIIYNNQKALENKMDKMFDYIDEYLRPVFDYMISKENLETDNKS